MEHSLTKAFTANCTTLDMTLDDPVEADVKQHWIFRTNNKIESVGCPGSFISVSTDCTFGSIVKLESNIDPGTENMVYSAINGTHGYISSVACMTANKVFQYDEDMTSAVLKCEYLYFIKHGSTYLCY